MGKKKISFTISKSVDKFRIPVPPPGSYHRDKNRYTRKSKFKKGWDRNGPNLSFM